MSAGWVLVVAVAVGAYEWGLRRHARRRGGPQGAGEPDRPAWRHWCWWAAAVLAALVGLPPLAPAARSSILAETVQFAVLGFGVAPLAVLGAPADALAGWRSHPQPRRPRATPAATGWWALGAFAFTTVAWRVPPAVDVLASGRGWLVVEALSLVGGTWWLWVAVLGAPPRLAVAQRPQRIALAALAAWTTWVSAYVVGFSSHAFYPSFATGRTPAAPQELGVIVLWAASAAALVPVAFCNHARWLGADQSASEPAAPRDAHRRGHRGPLHRALGS